MDKECGNNQVEMSIVNKRSPIFYENSNGFICTCSFLFYKSYKGDCISYIKFNTSIDQTRSENVIKDHDGISDDEPVYLTGNFECEQPDQMPCKPNSSICFS